MLSESNVVGRADVARLILSGLACAALAACGGGNGGGGSSLMTSAAAAEVTSAAASSPDGEEATVQALAVSGASDTSQLATENQKFTVSGTQLVRYGAGTKWVVKSVTGTGTCSNDYFGNDPIYGTVKACVLIAPIVLASENDTFQVSGTMAVRYGVGTKWVTKDVTTKGTCSNAFFGTDPMQGAVKSCQLVAASVLANVGGTAATVGLPASENSVFYVLGTRTVRYGANGKYVTQTVTGRASCSNASFGKDPLFGTVKGCDVVDSTDSSATTTVAAATQATVSAVASLAPAVDATKIVAAAVGYSTARVRPDDNVDPPKPSDIGDFREYCEFSHMSYDDPIVYPGSVGGHLHTFMGNTGTNRNSTANSLATSGNSTCAGGTLNRTAYWFPTMIDTKDGTPLKAGGSLMYYKQGYHFIPSAAIKTFPAGLRMVAGNSANKSGGQDGIANFTCWMSDGRQVSSATIPTDCPAGSTLTASVRFPQCWDGVNLDSPDHKSHMAYPDIGCPSTHPVALSEISFQVNYPVTAAEGTKNWRLSSDDYDRSLPGGSSSHADWFYGWDTATMTTWVTRCLNSSMDCHAFLIGDGTTLY